VLGSHARRIREAPQLGEDDAVYQENMQPFSLASVIRRLTDDWVDDRLVRRMTVKRVYVVRNPVLPCAICVT
jgi:hypothetical protein